MLTLYYAPGSSSFAPHIALYETGATFEAKPISLAANEHQTSEFLNLNVAGKVPVLMIDERPLTEVAAILYYLARLFPDARLLPPDSDIEAQARAIEWMSFVASGLHPVWSKGLELALPAFEIADKRLGGQQWAAGGQYSIADIHLFRLYWRFAGKHTAEAHALANLKRHHDQMMKRPAVIKTLAVETQAG